MDTDIIKFFVYAMLWLMLFLQSVGNTRMITDLQRRVTELERSSEGGCG